MLGSEFLSALLIIALSYRPSISGNMMAEAHPAPHSCINSTTEETRAFVESLFTAVALDNFGASFAAALSDDLVWTVSGSSVIAGTYPSKAIYIEKVLTPLRAVLVTLPVPIVEHIFADGNWATVNWRSEGVYGKNGANYDMQYAWLMRTGVDDEGDRKIVEVTGFYDSIKVDAVFGGYVFNTTKV
jgi:ketosteroid isomerase-like protein